MSRTRISNIIAQQTANTLFDKTFSANPHVELRKNAIIKQAIANAGINVNDKTVLSQHESEILENEFKNIIHAIGHLPKFVGSEKIELDNDQNPEDGDEAMKRAARNFLRHLTLGSTFEGDDRVTQSLIKRFLNLAMEKRAVLFSVARNEIQNIFNHAIEWIAEKNTENNKLSVDDERQFQIFMHGLLAIYPFLDPIENEQVILPQKVQNQWIQIQYQFQRMDISPQSGLLSKLIKDQDRLYAYGLVPMKNQHPEAQPYLLLMGTTFPTGQGEALSQLYNFYPRHSVGEGHDTSQIDAWIKKQDNKINVLGQSKGAVMSMITAARHHDKIDQAYCFNPTGLSNATLDRLNRKWQTLKTEEKPQIHVYAQSGDIVFPLENGFLEGTHIYRILPQTDNMPRLHKLLPIFLQRIYESHIHNFAGRESVIVLNVNTERENNSRWREFRGDMKEALNWITFPIKNLDLLAQLSQREIENKLPMAKIVTWPLSLLGKTLSTISLATFLTLGMPLGSLVAMSKVFGRTTFGIRSNYQLTMHSDSKGDTNSNNASTFTSSTKKLASLGLVSNVNSDSMEADVPKLTPKLDFTNPINLNESQSSELLTVPRSSFSH